MRHKTGTLCMIIGAVLVVLALSLFLWNRYEDRRAAQSAEEILTQVMAAIEQGADDLVQDPYDGEMPVVNIDGYDYIGYVSLPTLGLYLPVMAEWDYPRLKIAPCRYTGSTETNDLVIAAHNYSRHFGTIKTLQTGDDVTFTDMSGVTSHYKVVEVDVLNPMAVEEMTSGEFDLTLFTCTYGGQSRVTARCMRE